MDITAEDITRFFERLISHLPPTIQEYLARYTAKQWLRLTIIVCGYLLLRPMLMKFGARQQMKAHEKAEEEAAKAPGAKLTPNDLRGQKLVMPDESGEEDEGEAGEATGADWGKKARRRQRVMVKKMLEAHERKLAEEQEDDEDKDIEEFLVG